LSLASYMVSDQISFTGGAEAALTYS
jgi:hypothetical protein